MQSKHLCSPILGRQKTHWADIIMEILTRCTFIATVWFHIDQVNVVSLLALLPSQIWAHVKQYVYGTNPLHLWRTVGEVMGGIKEAATNFAIIAKERSGVFLDPFVWVLQEWCSFTIVEDNIMFFLSQLVLTTMILWNVPSDTLVGSIHYFGTQFVSLPWNIGLELAKWVVFSRHMEGQRRLWF